MKNIRNFSIIAHIDHGKSTLSDRIIQICGGLNKREMSSQVLDSMELERERGITIKAQSVTLSYLSNCNKKYKLNLIDTPGHVDFSYEVSRSLSACEGVLLIIDASQGIEAQTLSSYFFAKKMKLKVITIINKIDLPNINIKQILLDIKNLIGINEKKIIKCSAKTGLGISNVIKHIISDIPPPKGSYLLPLQAIIIDSWFDKYLGIISLIRIKNGNLSLGDTIQCIETKKKYCVDQIGIFTPKRKNCKILYCGEVGWISCGIKKISKNIVGYTLTLANNPSKEKLKKFKKIKPKVYASLFSMRSEDFKYFKDALKKLSLNDSSLFYEPEVSSVLGFGFRCGFLGLLHMEIVKERLEREYKLNIIATIPTVIYKIITSNNIIYIDSPSKLSNIKNIKEIHEPIAKCYIISPKKYLGKIIILCNKKRGIQKNMIFYSNRVELIYYIPMSEIILDFFDKLKSISHGYASLDYKFKKFKISDIVKLDIIINKIYIDTLSSLIHKNNIIYKAKKSVNNLKLLIPRQQFDISIQASIGNNIISRSTIKQLRKNVLAKCYGGDISRKKKLLKKQKLGKRKMKKIGNIDLPKEVFLSMLNIKKK
ncbi:translation elongation factor 4 [Sodalis-like secondary symbiont of Drepanosiphum platanoidis]|uniref:translation elongation factor 4 n=1 Tax=Sodalis-like secondary symbiont of Drepanosiphum platanoidis TaxID=2994493 RepID=UPI0034638FE6